MRESLELPHRGLLAASAPDRQGTAVAGDPVQAGNQVVARPARLALDPGFRAAMATGG